MRVLSALHKIICVIKMSLLHLQQNRASKTVSVSCFAKSKKEMSWFILHVGAVPVVRFCAGVSVLLKPPKHRLELVCLSHYAQFPCTIKRTSESRNHKTSPVLSEYECVNNHWSDWLDTSWWKHTGRTLVIGLVSRASTIQWYCRVDRSQLMECVTAMRN